MHHWAPKDENLRLLRAKFQQRKFKANVWAGVIKRYIVGPTFTEGEPQRGQVFGIVKIPVIHQDTSMVFRNDCCPAYYRPTLMNIRIRYSLTLGLEGAGVLNALNRPQILLSIVTSKTVLKRFVHRRKRHKRRIYHSQHIYHVW